MGKIILTDWPKLETINANLRGIETEKLLQILDQTEHLMMDYETEEAGGYRILYHTKKIEEELKFRKAAR
jgi:hypothetical protein